MLYNPINAIDAYKLDHRRQYPQGTTRVYSNFTPRSSRVPGVDKVVFFGLQAFLADYCMDSFDQWFAKSEADVQFEYLTMLARVLGPESARSIGTQHIRDLHRLGYLPLSFCALPEGTEVPLRVPMFTVENTHPDFFWLTNYIESVLSAAIWLPCTSATNAWHLRKLLDEWAVKTGSTKDAVNFQGHDFSFRGMEDIHSAAASGAGHLLSFMGTDSIPSLEYVDAFYPGENGLVGASVAATEHSVMCAGGEDGELETFERLLDLYPTGILSVVSDTWDLWHVLTNTLPKLKDKIMARDGKLVIRPDSGDPVNIICGDRAVLDGTHARSGAMRLLWREFGGTENSRGYKELDSHIGLIYGDSINYQRAEEMVSRLEQAGFASTNIVLGVGSYTYQFVTRDTFGFAMKATWAEINGQGHDLFKKPVTDDGIKNSATGRLAVIETDNGLTLIERATPEQEDQSLLQPVWEDGMFLNGHKRQSFAEVRAVLRAN